MTGRRGLEVGVGRGHLPVLVQNLDEVPKVCLLPVAARSLALFEDRVDSLLRRGEIGYRYELGPVEV